MTFNLFVIVQFCISYANVEEADLTKNLTQSIEHPVHIITVLSADLVLFKC